MSVIVVDGFTFNAEYFKKISEVDAVKRLSHVYQYSTIMKAWKVANGKSIPNTKKSSKSEKEKPIEETPIVD